MGDFDVVGDDRQASALVLERFGNRIQPALDAFDIRVDLFGARLNLLAGGIRFGFELLVLGTFL